MSFQQIATDVSPIIQYPELPTGCEITSLTMVLNYYGYKIDKIKLAAYFLETSNNYSDFDDKFIGSPFSYEGFGCFERAIINTANKYLGTKGYIHAARDCTGTIFESLLRKTEDGTPVIIWATIDMSRPFHTIVHYKTGEHVSTWVAPEHCLVLLGYNKVNNTVLIADPLYGIVEYDMDLVETRYMQMGAHAVILSKTKDLSAEDGPNFKWEIRDKKIPLR